MHDPKSGVTVTFGARDTGSADQSGLGASEGAAGFGDKGPVYDKERDAFVYSDGSAVRGTDPNGNVGRVNEAGDIEYSDGTVYSHDSRSGSSVIQRPDGTTRVIDAQGGELTVGGGMEVSTSGGGTKVHDPKSGVTAVFGGNAPEYSPSGAKDDQGAGDRGAGNRGQSGEASGGDTDSGSGSSSNDDGGKDSGSGNDSTDNQESDSSADSGEDGGDAGGEGGEGDQGNDAQGEGGDQYRSGVATSGGGPRAGAVLDDVIARARGERSDPESGVPDCAPAGSGPGGSVTQPAGGEAAGPCPPGGHGVSTEEGGAPAVVFEGASRQGRGRPGGTVVDPVDRDIETGVGDIEGAFNPFDRSPVVNPGPPR
ncbi:MAG: hypothetical protein Kow006_02970 [Gammaproteobacteria bacterium]